ncbi:hypothetical protein OOK36_55135 [Streptomyces sp. NBC_00365]|uniref:hypothetical protein n=1 Tax=Streptomyces sp. NBC_00365 TaxID=2975726 RepID=UPI00224DC5D9|nr:hypothetical protein [Streptomyces sp. NBC_00365]MCX5097590.1 hypothetical protein [Streptomyces sp. NBC_00365]
MSHRPYPSVDRARHQLDRHDDETRPQPPRAYETATAAVVFERWAAALRAAVPAAQQLVASWNAAFNPRLASSEEKTA